MCVRARNTRICTHMSNTSCVRTHTAFDSAVDVQYTIRHDAVGTRKILASERKSEWGRSESRSKRKKNDTKRSESLALRLFLTKYYFVLYLSRRILHDINGFNGGGILE